MPDHIHIFIKCQSLKHTIPSIVHMLKGSTSFKIRKRYPFLKKYRAFWSPSYFCETIGNMSENVIRKYIQNQKVNLKSTYKYLERCAFYVPTYTISKTTNELYNYFYLLNNQQIKIALL